MPTLLISLSLLSLSATLTASAGTAAAATACDAKSLGQKLGLAEGAEIAPLFMELADCNPQAAGKLANNAFPKMAFNTSGLAAAVKAVDIGAAGAASLWVEKLQSDDRASAIKGFGEKCNDDPAMQSFFVDRAKAKPQEFWDQRWYRALASCHVPAVQDILWTELEKGPQNDKSRFFSVLETYARSAGGEAVPRLKQLLLKVEDAEVQSNVVNAFPDAAGVGSPSGADPKASAAAVAAIVEAAPHLKRKAVEQARLTLSSLGDEAAADKLAGVYHKKAANKEGRLMWGAVVSETATCKKDKTSQRIHVAQVWEKGNTWGDQFEQKIRDNVKGRWSLDLASSCKAEEHIVYKVPAEPFEDEKAYQTWAEATVKELTDKSVKKVERVDEGALALP